MDHEGSPCWLAPGRWRMFSSLSHQVWCGSSVPLLCNSAMSAQPTRCHLTVGMSFWLVSVPQQKKAQSDPPSWDCPITPSELLVLLSARQNRPGVLLHSPLQFGDGQRTIVSGTIVFPTTCVSSFLRTQLGPVRTTLCDTRSL